MAMDFPSSPTVGQMYSVAGGPTYSWSGTAWRVLTPGSSFSRTTFTATAGQTVFTVNYPIGAVDVFRNGVKLVNGSDFTATDGATITLLNAATVGDTVEVIAYPLVTYANAAKAEDVYSVLRGFKNRIINGGMDIDQRNAGASVTPSASVYSVDRWQAMCNQASKYSVQRNAGAVAAPSGFTNYLGATALSSYSVGSGDYFALMQPIEGFNISDIGWGTSNAKSVTLSFWARSSLIGTFGGAFRNDDGNRSYPFTYAINSANTWEYKTITIPGDTAGTWKTNASTGIYVNFSLGMGSTFIGAAGAWAGANYLSATGAQSVVGTNGATFYITGVQLEVGTVTNPVFERRSYQQELAMCQRYYSASSDVFFVDAYGAVAANIDSGANVQIFFPVTMRSSPTLSVSESVNGGSTTVTQYLHRHGFCRLRKFTSSGSGSIRLAINSYTADAEL